MGYFNFLKHVHVIGILAVLHLITTKAETVTSYSSCNSTSQEFNGYTYTLDANGDKVWSHCGFPNPLFDKQRCGWPLNDQVAKRYVCDPDGVLEDIDIAKIDEALKEFGNASARQCNQENSIAAFVVVKKARVADAGNTNVCVNKCGEIHPSVVTSSESNVEATLENFAYNIRRQWKLGSCQNDMIIFYWHQQNKMYISYGDKITNFVPQKTMSASITTAQDSLSKNDSSSHVASAMEAMLKAFQPTFSLTQPATILFILNFCVMFVVAMFLVAFTSMSRKEYDVWGSELQWRILSKVLYYMSGLWVIEMIFKGVLWVQNQSLVVVLVVPLTLCGLCLIGFVVVILQSG